MISQVPNNVTAKSSPSYPAWVTDELLRGYYDTEWGVPVTDERGLFEAQSRSVPGGSLLAYDSCAT